MITLLEKFAEIAVSNAIVAFIFWRIMEGSFVLSIRGMVHIADEKDDFWKLKFSVCFIILSITMWLIMGVAGTSEMKNNWYPAAPQSLMWYVCRAFNWIFS